MTTTTGEEKDKTGKRKSDKYQVENGPLPLSLNEKLSDSPKPKLHTLERNKARKGVYKSLGAPDFL